MCLDAISQFCLKLNLCQVCLRLFDGIEHQNDLNIEVMQVDFIQFNPSHCKYFFIDLKGGRLQDKTVTSTTEIIHANGTVEEGKDLPKKSDGHCMVLLPPGTKVRERT